MFAEELLEAIQAERNRQIREADRVRLLTPVEAEVAPAATLPTIRPIRASALEGRATCRQPRPATDTSP
jgi:hypothetical protein